MMFVTFGMFILWYLTIGYVYTTVVINNGLESGKVSKEMINEILCQAPPNLRMFCWYAARIISLLIWPSLFIKLLIIRFRGHYDKDY